MLLEARPVGAGASGRNGGMVSAGFAASHTLLERAVGPVAARTLIGLSREAMALMRAPRSCGTRSPASPSPGVLVASWFDDAAGLQAEVAAMNDRFGMELEFWPRERLRRAYPSPRYWDGIFDPEGFHLDPLALCRGYAAAAVGQGARSVRGHARHRARAESAAAGGSPPRAARCWPSASSCARAPTRRA